MRRSGPGGVTIKSIAVHLRIFAYSSNIVVANFDPMVSMLASGTRKNLRFFLRSCSLRDRDPSMKLICSTFHPCCCSVTPRDHLRDTYWSSARDRARVRYWSVTSLMRLNSRMHRVHAFVLVDSRNARSSGLSLQNLVCITDSFVWSATINFSSDCVKGCLVSSSLSVFQMESDVIFSYLSSS